MRRAPLALLAAALLAACGLKSAPVAPELVRPLAPDRVAATSIADGVRLQWRRPEHYSGGGRMHDLGGFDVQRRRDEAGAPFETIGTVRLSDQRRFRPTREIEWVDRTAQSGAAYAYRVIAFTTGGDRSAPSPPVTITHRVPPATATPPGR